MPNRMHDRVLEHRVDAVPRLPSGRILRRLEPIIADVPQRRAPFLQHVLHVAVGFCWRGPSAPVVCGSSDPATRGPRTSTSCNRGRRRGHGGAVSPATRTPDRQSWVARPMRPVPGSRRRGNGGRVHRVEGPRLEQPENDTREQLMAWSPRGSLQSARRDVNRLIRSWEPEKQKIVSSSVQIFS